MSEFVVSGVRPGGGREFLGVFHARGDAKDYAARLTYWSDVQVEERESVNEEISRRLREHGEVSLKVDGHGEVVVLEEDLDSVK